MQVIICITGSHPWNFPEMFPDSMIPVCILYILPLTKVSFMLQSDGIYQHVSKKVSQKNAHTQIYDENSKLKLQPSC